LLKKGVLDRILNLMGHNAGQQMAQKFVMALCQKWALQDGTVPLVGPLSNIMSTNFRKIE
jgi:hypothetical protein